MMQIMVVWMIPHLKDINWNIFEKESEIALILKAVYRKNTKAGNKKYKKAGHGIF